MRVKQSEKERCRMIFEMVGAGLSIGEQVVVESGGGSWTVKRGESGIEVWGNNEKSGEMLESHFDACEEFSEWVDEELREMELENGD